MIPQDLPITKAPKTSVKPLTRSRGLRAAAAEVNESGNAEAFSSKGAPTRTSKRIGRAAKPAAGRPKRSTKRTGEFPEGSQPGSSATIDNISTAVKPSHAAKKPARRRSTPNDSATASLVHVPVGPAAKPDSSTSDHARRMGSPRKDAMPLLKRNPPKEKFADTAAAAASSNGIAAVSEGSAAAAVSVVSAAVSVAPTAVSVATTAVSEASARSASPAQEASEEEAPLVVPQQPAVPPLAAVAAVPALAEEQGAMAPNAPPPNEIGLARMICRNLREREAEYEIAGPMLGDISPRMWAILVDWMIEVQVNFRLGTDCLYLAVYILNQFVRSEAVRRSNLQLAGAASMVIASKHEEIFPPEINDFVYICADTYPREEILAMERQVLRVLDYRLCAPLASTFLSQYSLMLEPRSKHVGEFLLEMTLQDYHFCVFPASLLAAGAAYLAGNFVGTDVWTDPLATECGYSKEKVIRCAKLINYYIVADQHHERDLLSCRQKYSDAAYDEVGADQYNFVFDGLGPVIPPPVGGPGPA